VELFIILFAMGAGYSLLTDSSGKAFYFELFAVWSTLALIGGALLTDVAPAISLLIAALVIAPLWYATLAISSECARSEAADTFDLWSRWRAATGMAGPTRLIPGRDLSLAHHLDSRAQRDDIEEIEITAVPEDLLSNELSPTMRNLELAPMEAVRHHRGRNI